MLKQQRARVPGEELALCGRTYRVEEIVDTDGMCINYHVTFPQMPAGWEGMVCELYPRNMERHIRRRKDGVLSCDAVGEQALRECASAFWEGFQAQAALLTRLFPDPRGGMGYFPAYGTCYAARMLPKGQRLSEVLERGPCSFAQAMAYGTALLDAVECYHQRGLLHLDICPQTVRLLPERGVLLEHRGYGLWHRNVLGPFPLRSTPEYVSPEVQLRNFSEIGPAADLYAVCAVLFRLLVGRPLGEEELLGSGLRRVFSPRLAAAHRISPQSMEELGRVLRRGLHTLPRKRYPSAAELRQALAGAEQA